MYFKPLALLTATLIPMASALRYAGFSSTVSCTGPNFFCNDGGAICCGPMPTGYGFSAQFQGLPAGTQGQGYRDACRSFLFAVFGPGDRCWNGGGARATHLNWFHSRGRHSINNQAENLTCADVSGFSYTDHTGSEKTIKIAKGEADTVAGLFLKKDFTALANYADY